MLSLASHHIVDLFCLVAELLPSASVKAGRPSILSDIALITILLWNVLLLDLKTIKALWRFACAYLRSEFPKVPSYNAFLDHCHRVMPRMVHLLQRLLSTDDPIKIGDSTMLPVCRMHRANRHRVAKGVAAFGYNHQGTHFGFKLHLSITLSKRLCAIVFTPADVYDGQVAETIFNVRTRIGIGDSHYGASIMRGILWERSKTIIVAPPHYKQRKKVMAFWQFILLNERSKIESVFDILKEHLLLVSSFPRSVRGYLVHYIPILLGYQIMALGT